jgi:dTDP-glucose pyrophosphorylase
MILLTLAAGLGSRAQSGDYVPKALISVNDKPLIYWSIDSYHPLRASGMVTNENLYVVVRQSDLKSFNLMQTVSKFISPLVKVIELDELTSGPAASAYLAIKQLLRDGSISLNDPIIINDCDHHFNGNRLLTIVNDFIVSEENQVFVCTTSKNPMDLTWSFVQESEGEIIGLVEKPADHSDRSINYFEGVIGVYGFSKIKFFLELVENAIETKGELEFFISAVIDEGIKSGTITSIKKVHIENFTSLGTNELIKKATSENLLGGSFRESGTLFVDLDGTIFKHDNGGGVGNFEWDMEPQLVSEGIPAWLQSVKISGFSIVITSARPEKARQLVIDQLATYQIPFNQLILGLSGGPRFLFNDTKDSLVCLPTAYVMNYPRDQFPIDGASKLLKTISQISIKNEFKGESGERTFLLQDVDKFLIRKQSQNTFNSRNLIKYQVKWFEVVNEFYPMNVPKILQTNIHTDDSTLYFDSEYIPDLMPFGDYLSSLPSDTQLSKVTELASIFSGLYNRFKVETGGNLEYLLKVIDQKARFGLVNGFSSLHLSIDMPITSYVNGRTLKNVWGTLSTLLDAKNPHNIQLLESKFDKRTLIHGDPTLSNIMCTSNGQIFLLDPIGSRVMPDFNQSIGLGRANPIFDHSRVRLSLENEYERWANEIVVEESLGETNYLLAPSQKQKLYSEYRRAVSMNNDDYDLAVEDLLHITTLARIFPYKAKSKKKEAYFILGLLDVMSNEYMETYW